jgi:polyferredoxin
MVNVDVDQRTGRQRAAESRIAESGKSGHSMNVENAKDIQPEVAVEEPRLYKAREPIFPKSVKGWFRTMKWRILWFALAVYYLLPWIRWDRGEFAPDQAVLVDLANRRFYLLLDRDLAAGILLRRGPADHGRHRPVPGHLDSVGRAWCGYFCPQTVWTDLYMWVERWIDGDRNAQIKLHEAPWSGTKIRKRVSKHAIWLLIAMRPAAPGCSISQDAPTLFVDLLTFGPAMVAYVTIAVLTFTTYSLAGLMREQVCIYMCPWPRIQGAMLDENSLTVTYNDWRGEPRMRHKRERAEKAALGKRGRRLRRLQRLRRGLPDGHRHPPRPAARMHHLRAVHRRVRQRDGQGRAAAGLISYNTFKDYARQEAGDAAPTPVLKRVFRLRTILYFAVWAGIGLAMLVVLTGRDRIDLNVLHDRNPLFTPLSTGEIRNGYTVKALNMLPEPRDFTLSISGLPGAEMELAGSDDAPSTSITFEVEPDKLRQLRIYVTAPVEDERTEFLFTLVEASPEGGAPESDRVEGVFYGPDR